MFANRIALLALSLVTLGLLFAAYLQLEQERHLKGDLAHVVESASGPGSDLAQAGLRALQVGDATAARRLFQRAIDAAPTDSRWELLLRTAEIELEAQRRNAGYPSGPNDPTPY